MVYSVGLTGSIASGKSTAAEIFSNLGAEVIGADKIAKELTALNQPAYKKIVAHYGASILSPTKEINRKQLRELIFSNTKEKDWLEQLLHPLICDELKKRVLASTKPYCMVEIPLLITKANYPYLNRIALIDAPEELQLARVMQRDQCTKEQALTILKAQPELSLRLKYCDDVVINNKSKDALAKAIQELHCLYLRKAMPEFKK